MRGHILLAVPYQSKSHLLRARRRIMCHLEGGWPGLMSYKILALAHGFEVTRPTRNQVGDSGKGRASAHGPASQPPTSYARCVG